MYCPNCGGDVFEDLIGGCCRYNCVYCGRAVKCWNRERTEVIKGTEAITSQREASSLQEKYNQSDENRKRGEENLQKHFESLEKQRRKNLAFVEMMSNIGRRPSDFEPLKIKEVSLEEFKKIFKERKNK